MIDKRLMNPEFNPIDDHAILLPRSDEMVRAGQVFVTIFDRAMLAAMDLVSKQRRSLSGNQDDALRLERVRPASPSEMMGDAADFAIAFLEERAKRLGIEVTP